LELLDDARVGRCEEAIRGEEVEHRVVERELGEWAPDIRVRAGGCRTVRSMSIEVCYGRWFGSLVFVTRERLDEFAACDATMRLALGSDSWEQVLAVRTLEEIEAHLGTVLDCAWRSANPDSEFER
jgi:hypothetical protein